MKTIKFLSVLSGLLLLSIPVKMSANGDPGCNYVSEGPTGYCVPYFDEFEGTFLLYMECEDVSAHHGYDECYFEGDID